MKKLNNHLKEAVVLLFAMLMVSSTLAIANTGYKQISEPEIRETWLGYNDIQPQTMGDEWFQYDDSVPEYVIGWSTVPLIAQFAIRLTNEELATYDGCKIVGVEWYHAVTNESIPTHDYDIMIYEGNETLPLIEKVNESDSVTGETYAYHEFTEEYTIDASKDIWIVCHPYVYDAVEFYDYPVGYDTNPASWHEGKSSWRYRIDLGGWYEYHPAGLNGSWCLHVKIYVPEPVLGIESIKGPIGVTATINNTGDAKATNVTATINATGGFILIGKTKTITVGDIDVGGIGKAKSLIIGFGKPTIEVIVTCDEGKIVNATYTPKLLFLFFVL